MPTRRRVLRGLASGATVGLVAGAATASHGGDGEYAPPEDVTIDFPADAMDRYRPALELPADETERSRFIALYGWRARSDDWDRDWYVYWSSWTNQVGAFDATSHDGDHEPFYVGVVDGQPVEVLYSAYHWLRGGVTTPALPLVDDTHVNAHVVVPWHQYQVRPTDRHTLPEVRDLGAVFEAWLDNGLREDLRPQSVHQPPRMREWASWWRDDFGGTLTETIYQAIRPLGLGRQGGLL